MSDSVHCVFVHGWAMNSAVWDNVLGQLPSWLQVSLLDLPGHGSMAGTGFTSLDDLAQVLAASGNRPALWVGWSMGALAVMRLAELYPQRVAAALLVAANPCFVTRPGWETAVDAAVFEQFASDLARQQEKTLRRFLALQVKGVDDALSLVRQLQASLKARGNASMAALDSGLAVLLHSDLRASLKTVDAPLHWLLGGRDALVPAALAPVLEKDYGQKHVRVQADAGHAPFLSHPQAFVQQLLSIAEPLRSGHVSADGKAGGERR